MLLGADPAVVPGAVAAADVGWLEVWGEVGLWNALLGRSSL